MTGEAPGAQVEQAIRCILGVALGLEPAFIDTLPADTEFFGPKLGLTSLGGVRLLVGVQEEFGVDVADLDLDLASLRSIATLRDFVVAHL